RLIVFGRSERIPTASGVSRAHSGLGPGRSVVEQGGSMVQAGGAPGNVGRAAQLPGIGETTRRARLRESGGPRRKGHGRREGFGPARSLLFARQPVTWTRTLSTAPGPQESLAMSRLALLALVALFPLAGSARADDRADRKSPGWLLPVPELDRDPQIPT